MDKKLLDLIKSEYEFLNDVLLNLGYIYDTIDERFKDKSRFEQDSKYTKDKIESLSDSLKNLKDNDKKMKKQIKVEKNNLPSLASLLKRDPMHPFNRLEILFEGALQLLSRYARLVNDNKDKFINGELKSAQVMEFHKDFGEYYDAHEDNFKDMKKYIEEIRRTK